MTSDHNQPADARLLATLEFGCPWGVLLITDDESTESIPSWASDEEQVTSMPSALVARVMHQDDGEVVVRVWDGDGAFGGSVSFRGEIQIDSGRLRISDALGQVAVVVVVANGRHCVDLYSNSAVEASEINLVLDPVGQDQRD
jgi:hypothetical protein